MPVTIRAESKSSVMAKLVQRFIRGRRFDPCPPFCLVARYVLRVEAAISPLTESPSRDNQILCHENHFCIGIYSLFTTPCTIIYVCYPIPTPALFRPLGPPMFDSPKIAS